jgi:hypothetical protein
LSKVKVAATTSGQAAGRDINQKEQADITINTGSISGSNNIIGFHGNIQIQSQARPRIKVIIQPGPEHLPDAQKARLRELVNEVVDLETAIKRKPKRHATIWSALTGKLKVTSYHLIPADSFGLAEAYLKTWCARLRSAKSASKKDPDWRNSRYRYIHAALKEIERHDDLPGLLVDRYSGRSLKDLSSLELEAVYRIIAEWKKQARRKGA